jgi:hypothetical protein
MGTAISWISSLTSTIWKLLSLLLQRDLHFGLKHYIELPMFDESCDVTEIEFYCLVHRLFAIGPFRHLWINDPSIRVCYRQLVSLFFFLKWLDERYHSSVSCVRATCGISKEKQHSLTIFQFLAHNMFWKATWRLCKVVVFYILNVVGDWRFQHRVFWVC